MSLQVTWAGAGRINSASRLQLGRERESAEAMLSNTLEMETAPGGAREWGPHSRAQEGDSRTATKKKGRRNERSPVSRGRHHPALPAKKTACKNTRCGKGGPTMCKMGVRLSFPFCREESWVQQGSSYSRSLGSKSISSRHPAGHCSHCLPLPRGGRSRAWVGKAEGEVQRPATPGRLQSNPHTSQSKASAPQFIRQPLPRPFLLSLPVKSPSEGSSWKELVPDWFP